jgi:YVTN family beta-propeller protein
MDFRILGPLEVRDDRGEISLGRGKQRALLALLLIHPNESLSIDRLIDELWEEQPPPTAAKILQNYVSQLRRVLGDDRLQTQARGYALRVELGELDVDRFRQQFEEGKRARAAGDPERAALLLREALAMWRGPPLSDFTYEAFAGHEIGRLEELHLGALTERIAGDLALGRHADLIGELEGLVARYPLQERLRAQLMLALYRSGRQAEALQVYQDARRTLAEELGIEPGQALQQREKAILVQDPSLEPPLPEQSAGLGTVKASRRTRALLAVVALLVAAAAIAAGILLSIDHAAKPVTAVSPNEVGAIDPGTNRVVGAIPVGNGPARIAAGFSSVWAMNAQDGTVSRISPVSMRVDHTFPVDVERGNGGAITSIAAGVDDIWVANGRHGTLIGIRGNMGFLRGPPFRFERENLRDLTDITAVGETLWATSQVESSVTVVDTETERSLAKVPTAVVPLAITAGEGSVWLTGFDPKSKTGLLVRIDPTRKIVTATIPLPGIPGDVAVGFGAVWVTVSSQNAVWRIDPKTTSVVRTISVGDGPAAVAVGENAVWVVNTKDGTVSKIHPMTSSVVATIPVGGSPRDVAVGGGRIWVAVS